MRFLAFVVRRITGIAQIQFCLPPNGAFSELPNPKERAYNITRSVNVRRSNAIHSPMISKIFARTFHPPMSTWLRLLLLPCLGATMAEAANPRRGLSVSTEEAAGQLIVAYEGQRLLLYAFAANQFKPYVKELYTLTGDNVLRDAPADHLHHHGLMYGITVNGVNFWEEGPNAGRQQGAQPPLGSLTITAAGLPQAVILHSLHWVPGNVPRTADPAAAAWLNEQRLLTLTVDAARQEVSLEWRSEFQVGPGVEKATLSGADYHGLGLRFPGSLDRVARHQNAGNLPYPTQGKRDVLEAVWSAVSGPVNGTNATIAVFSRPTETRGPTQFFTMLEPFTYLSATQGLDQAPLEYAAGERFKIRYLVTVQPGLPPPATLARRYQVWLKD